MDPERNKTEFRVVNDIVVSYSPENQLEPEQALNRALQSYRDSFFRTYPYYEKELGNLSFSQKIAAEAPDLPKNGQEAYQADVDSWRDVQEACEWVQGYQDLHFILRGIKKYSITRLVDHREVIQDFTGNIRRHIPLVPNLREEYQDIVGGLETSMPIFMDCEKDWEIKTLNLVYDPDPTKSFWPPRNLDKQYYLFRNGFTFNDPEPGGAQSLALNNVSEGLGLNPIVEQNLNQMMITQNQQVEIGNTLKRNYAIHQVVGPPGHGFSSGGSISLSCDFRLNPLVIVSLTVFVFLWFWHSFFTKKKLQERTSDIIFLQETQ